MSIENLPDAGFRGRALGWPPKSSGTPLVSVHVASLARPLCRRYPQCPHFLRLWQPPRLTIQPLSAPNQPQAPDHRPRVLRTPCPSVRSMVAHHPNINKITRYLLRLLYLTSGTLPHHPMHTILELVIGILSRFSSSIDQTTVAISTSRTIHLHRVARHLSSLAHVPVSW